MFYYRYLRFLWIFGDFDVNIVFFVGDGGNFSFIFRG